MSVQESPFELLVRITAEEQKITRFEAAAKLTVMSVHINALADAEKFAEIARERVRAGERPAKQESGRPAATHRCKECGCLWLLWDLFPDSGSGWSLADAEQKPGKCCDNAAMGEQIEALA